MNIIDNIKEQRQKDKERAKKEFNELKEYAKESFNKENRAKSLEEKKARLQSKELKDFSKTQYKVHIQLILLGIVFLMVGFIFPPAFILAVAFEISGGLCYVINRKRINSEYELRKNIK